MASFRRVVIATLIMTVVEIFPNVCLWRRSLCSNLAGIDPEKLYRSTFICQYGLCCCIVWPSFLFDCFVKIWATCKNFLGKWFTPPPWPKIARTPMPPHPNRTCLQAYSHSPMSTVSNTKLRVSVRPVLI